MYICKKSEVMNIVDKANLQLKVDEGKIAC